MTRVLLSLSVLVSLAVSAGFVACATGGSNGASPSDGGEIGSPDGVSAGDAGAWSADGGAPEGGSNATLTQACSDNATQYCTQLAMCSPFLLNTTYGTKQDCIQRWQGAYCQAFVSAKGSGWTGPRLEACIAARAKQTCSEFLYAKPGPAACNPGGSLPVDAGCLFNPQCGSGYCRVAPSAACGTCAALGNTGSACTTSNDCGGNLLCSPTGNACVTPLPLGAMCVPDGGAAGCQTGLACLDGKCAAPGAVGAACDPDAGGIDCDSNLGAYCAGTTCATIPLAMVPGACGPTPSPGACYGDAPCIAGACQPAVPDGQPCSEDSGINCVYPSECIAGLCATPTANDCP